MAAYEGPWGNYSVGLPARRSCDHGSRLSSFAHSRTPGGVQLSAVVQHRASKKNNIGWRSRRRPAALELKAITAACRYEDRAIGREPARIRDGVRKEKGGKGRECNLYVVAKAARGCGVDFTRNGWRQTWQGEHQQADYKENLWYLSTPWQNPKTIV